MISWTARWCRGPARRCSSQPAKPLRSSCSWSRRPSCSPRPVRASRSAPSAAPDRKAAPAPAACSRSAERPLWSRASGVSRSPTGRPIAPAASSATIPARPATPGAVASATAPTPRRSSSAPGGTTTATVRRTRASSSANPVLRWAALAAHAWKGSGSATRSRSAASAPPTRADPTLGPSPRCAMAWTTTATAAWTRGWAWVMTACCPACAARGRGGAPQTGPRSAAPWTPRRRSSATAGTMTATGRPTRTGQSWALRATEWVSAVPVAKSAPRTTAASAAPRIQAAADSRPTPRSATAPTTTATA